MAKDLEEALTNIESKLGGSEKPHMDLGEHLEYIESLIGGGEGTKVIPNPELSGDEPALTGLQVGDDKFKVSGGSSSGGTQLYKHVIEIEVFYGSDAFQTTCELILASDVSLTNKDIYEAYKYNFISGVVDVGPIYDKQEQDLEQIANMPTASEPAFVYLNEYGSPETLYCSSFGTDTVTAL